jgi:sterol desaturase/sphingolipid hydroxylase (fatty acid hydroxylase superfamily)
MLEAEATVMNNIAAKLYQGPSVSLFYISSAIVIILGIFIEYRYDQKHQKNWYNIKDLFTNLNISAGHLFWGAIVTPFSLAGYHLIQTHLGYQDLEALMGSPVLFFITGYIITDFIAYWTHRLGHTYNILIAGHITHHSSKYLNMSTCMRVNWFLRFYNWILFIPMALIGFELKYFVIFHVISNIHNALCHIRFQPQVGFLKYIFLTPQTHHLHHSAEKKYAFKNFAASLVIWDILFKTFVVEKETQNVKIGLSTQLESNNPFHVNFHFFQEAYLASHQANIPYIKYLFSKPTRHIKRKSYVQYELELKTKYWLIPLGTVLLGAIFSTIHTGINIPMKLMIIAGYFGISYLIFYILDLKQKNAMLLTTSRYCFK